MEENQKFRKDTSLVLLIGVDPETHQALVWTARQSAAVAANDLVSVILNENKTD